MNIIGPIRADWRLPSSYNLTHNIHIINNNNNFNLYNIHNLQLLNCKIYT